MSEVAPVAPAAPTAAPAPAAAPTPTPAPAAAAPPAGSAQANWSDSLSPEMKDLVTQRGFKDPGQVLESYVNLEKLRGVPQDRLLKLPETPDAPEWKDIYKKLGTPDTKDGYELKPAKGDDPEFFNWASDTFHGLNLTKTQAQGILQKFGEFVSNRDTQTSESYKIKTAQQEAQLKKEWGAAYGQNSVNADLAIKKLGIPDNAVKALGKELGFDGAMKLLNTIGSNMGEASFVGAGSGNGFGNQILTPAQAKARIQSLKQDPGFTQKYLSKDAQAMKTMTDLHAMANPGEV